MRDAARESATLPFPRPEFPEPQKGPATDVTETKAMTNEELRTLNKTRRIQQIAWLTRDLEKSMQQWIDVLKIGPWRVFQFTDKTVKNLKVGGKLVEEPFEFRIAITHVGDMEIELIQPVRGPMIYQEYLDRRGEGLHHIKEKLPDDKLPTAVTDYEKRGIAVTQTGQFVADFHFYLDTEPRLDFIYELGNCPYQDLPPDMVSTYPPEAA